MYLNNNNNSSSSSSNDDEERRRTRKEKLQGRQEIIHTNQFNYKHAIE